MQIFPNGSFVLTRGDSFTAEFSLKHSNIDSLKTYQLTAKDTVYFGIFDDASDFEHAVVKKKYNFTDDAPVDNIKILLIPEDTVDLLPGDYYYSIKLKTTEDDKITVKSLVSNVSLKIID